MSHAGKFHAQENKNMPSLTSYTIARKNIRRSPARSFCLITAGMILSAFLFAGTVLILSLSNGANSMANRLGADIMLVPAGYDPHTENIMLSGKPSAFYLPPNALNDVKALGRDDIAQISPQIFMATLRASCCAYPVQIMGVDWESDFIVRPWLEGTLKRPLNDGEIILGHHSTGNPGDEIIFFNIPLKIAGRLERTGMGFDSSVFMNRNTIITLANAANKIRPQKLAADNNLISVIMLKLKPGTDTAQTAREINRSLNAKGIYALFSKRFVANISSSLVNVSRVITYFLAAIWLMSAIIIALLFSLNVSSRKKEYGVLRAIGASRIKLAVMILHEAIITGGFGAVAGIILGGIIIMSGSPFVAESLRLPFLIPSWPTLAFVAVASGITAIFTGLCASGIFAFKAGHDDIHENLR